MPTLVAFAFVLVAPCPVSAQVPQLPDPPPFDWDAADRAIVRLDPDRFPELPKAIRAYLKTRRFTVPQPVEKSADEVVNVIRGRFRSSKSDDWAVLASRDRVSRIFVFLGGLTRKPIELETQDDAKWLTYEGYCRQILAADAEVILSYRTAWGDYEDRNFPITHDGIEDAFVGKGSSVHYLRGGKWWVLTGAD